MLTNLDNIVRYAVSGSSYAITYPYWSVEEIKAYITLPDGTVNGLTYGTDFTVTAPNGVNGTLTKVSAWTDAEKLTIVREVELTQEIDLINGEKIDGEQLETGLDLKTAGLQQLNEKSTRSVMTSIDETGDNMVIPNSTARKGTGDGTLLGFDGTGGNIVLRDLKQFDADVANTSTNATIASTAASNALASENKAQKWAEEDEDVPVEPSKYSAKHWAMKASASAVTPDNAVTLTNKTIDAKNNTISCSPTTITSNTTITPTKEMNVVVTTDYACVTVASSAPYIGYQLPITFSGCIGFVKFNSVCEAINRTSITLIWTGTTWTVQSGATFFLSDVVYTNRPTGTTPSNWKDFVGVGEYNFTYAYTGGDYDIPLVNSNITMTWRNGDAVSAIAVNSFVNSASVNTTTQAWVRRGNGTPLVWATNWTPIFPMIYSTTEFDTGMKWIDGKRIYCKIINDIGTWSLTANTNDNKTVSITGASEVLEVTGKFHINYNSGQSEWDAQLPYVLLGSHFVCVNGAGTNFFTIGAKFLANTVLSNFAIKVLYTK